MNKNSFISQRTDTRELLLSNSIDYKYILVEGKNDKLFYSRYFEPKLSRKRNKVRIMQCDGVVQLCELLERKRIKNKSNNYYAIMDRDSRCFWSSRIKSNVFDPRTTLFTDGYCLENYFFTKINYPKTLDSVRPFLLIEEVNKPHYLADLKELLKEFLTEFCDESYFTPCNDYFQRSPINNIDIRKKGDVETITLHENANDRKYYDKIPSSYSEIHGKDLLLAFVLFVRYLDTKYDNKGQNIYSDRGQVLNLPHQLIDKIKGFKIKNLDNFFKLVTK